MKNHKTLTKCREKTEWKKMLLQIYTINHIQKSDCYHIITTYGDNTLIL